MPKEISFSHARQQLSTIVDEVQKPGKAVTIVRHGKPAAVIISHDQYQDLFEGESKLKKSSLVGSVTIPKGVDIDEALRKGSEKNARMWKARILAPAKEMEESG